MDSYEFKIVDEGCAGKSTKRPQWFHEEFWTGIQKITAEQSRTELGQLHMRINVEVFGEKDPHSRECKFETPRPKYDSKLEYKSGVQMFLYQETVGKVRFN